MMVLNPQQGVSSYLRSYLGNDSALQLPNCRHEKFLQNKLTGIGYCFYHFPIDFEHPKEFRRLLFKITLSGNGKYKLILD